MKTKIESRDLLSMGISKKAFEMYSNTDPINIYKIGNGFKVTGVFEFTCDTEADLLKSLEELAEDYE